LQTPGILRSIVVLSLLSPFVFAGFADASAPVGAALCLTACASAHCGPTSADATGDGLTSRSASANVNGLSTSTSSSTPTHAQAQAAGAGIGSSAHGSGSTVILTLRWSASASCTWPPAPKNTRLSNVGCVELDDNADVIYTGAVAFSPSTQQSWFAGQRQQGESTSSFAFPATLDGLTFQRSMTGVEPPTDLAFSDLNLKALFSHASDGGLDCNVAAS
jgi:hypothetical protein